jgi:hypothetical protein
VVGMTGHRFCGHVLDMSQLGSSVGVAPVAVGVMRVKTIAAQFGPTLNAGVNMSNAEALAAIGARRRACGVAYGTKLRLVRGKTVGL